MVGSCYDLFCVVPTAGHPSPTPSVPVLSWQKQRFLSLCRDRQNFTVINENASL